MNKFPETSDLKGYGFDVAADRVVRFNKYPDGTYLNTRATYSINGKQYTHYDIRTRSIQEQSTVLSVSKPTVAKTRRWIVIVLCIVLLASLGQCNVNFSVNHELTQESI